MKNFLFIIVLLLFSFNICEANNLDIYPFQTAKQQRQFQHLTYELRCLVCQNQNLAESNAALATDLRNEIANKIRIGRTNQQIINYLVARYGDYILYKPPVNKATYILWFTPFILLIAGMLVLLTIIWRSRKINRD